MEDGKEREEEGKEEVGMMEGRRKEGRNEGKKVNFVCFICFNTSNNNNK